MSTAKEDDVSRSKSYKILDATLLESCISEAAICSVCCDSKSKLELFQENVKRQGLAESLFFKCNKCFYKSKFKTSKIVGEEYSQHSHKPYDINVRSVFASQNYGRTGLVKFCAAMGFPNPSNAKAYNKIQKNLSRKTEMECE